MTELTNMDTNEKIDEIIENWFIIEFKDADFVKEAKMEARKNMKQAILSLIHQAEIKELQRHIIWDGDNVGGIFMTRQEVDERIKALEKEIV